MRYLSKSEKQTKKIAEQLAKKLKGGEVIALIGDLGAGKTTFIQGLAKGLKIKKNVNSPTFVLMKIYPVKQLAFGEFPASRGFNRVNPLQNLSSNIQYLCHIDAYRIKNPAELADIGVLEYFKDKNIVSVVEWADKIKSILPKKIIEILIKHGLPRGTTRPKSEFPLRGVPRGKRENERIINIVSQK